MILPCDWADRSQSNPANVPQRFSCGPPDPSYSRAAANSSDGCAPTASGGFSKFASPLLIQYYNQNFATNFAFRTLGPARRASRVHFEAAPGPRRAPPEAAVAASQFWRDAYQIQCIAAAESAAYATKRTPYVAPRRSRSFAAERLQVQTKHRPQRRVAPQQRRDSGRLTGQPPEPRLPPWQNACADAASGMNAAAA
jgi:hypothetical protein